MPRADAAKGRTPAPAPLAFFAIGASLLAACLAVDTRAEAAFDAPKRLLVLIAIAAATIAQLLGERRPPRERARLTRRILVLAGAALLGAAAASCLSPRPVIALDALRSGLLFALLIPLGASSAAEGARGRILATLFVGAAALNAGLAILESLGWIRLFDVESAAGRGEASALIGNPGLLGLVLALATVAALALAAAAKTPLGRLAWVLTTLVLLGGLLVTRGLTALVSLGVGVSVLGALVLGRRALAPLLVASLLAGAALVATPLRSRVGDTLAALSAGDWDRLLTYRLGAWAAAVEMIRERPITGSGPGTFGAEFVPHRLRAELRQRTRFVTPSVASSYGEAHSDYLQLAAEVGIPASLAALAAVGALAAGLIRRGLSPDPRGREAALLAALLCAGAAAAFTWFPLQRPSTAVPLLLVAGRGFRLLDDAEREGAA